MASLSLGAGHPDHWRAKGSQLQDNLASFDLALSAEQVKALDEASQIDPVFAAFSCLL